MIRLITRRRICQVGSVAPFRLHGGSRLAAAPDERDARKRGGTLTMLLDPEPPVLISMGNTAGPTKMLSPKVAEGLLTYDFELNPLPQLATEWQVSEDRLTYQFSLRQGVKWHDGAEFTAEDAAFSIELARENHPNGRSTFANLRAAETPDQHTLVLVLSKPNLALITALAANETPMLPKHVYQGRPYVGNPANFAPIGTGPFIFKEWSRGNYIAYERNPHYWDAPKPFIDRLVVRLIADPSAATAAFETGEIDLGFNNPVPLSDVARLQALSHIGMETRGYEYNSPLTQFIFNLDRPYIRDLKVRQAIAHAIDREAILQTAWYGYGVVGPGPVSPRLKRYFATDLPGYAFDPSTADRLLDEAGYPRQPDGMRFALMHDFLPYGPTFRRVADYLKPALARVGIRLNIRSQDFATYITRVYTDRDFDTVNAWLSTGYDPTGIQRYFWSKDFKKGLPFSNTAHYANPAADQLLERAAIEPDIAERIALYKEFQHLVVTDLPEIGLVSQTLLTIYNKRVHDHTVSGDGINGNFANVYLDQTT